MHMNEQEYDASAAAFSRRLQEWALKHGITGPLELSKLISDAGYKLKISSVKRHWNGRDVPTGRNLLAYSEVLDVSTDYLLLGKEPQLPGLSDLLQTIRKVAAHEQRALPELKDPERELMSLVLKLTQPDAIKILINMTRSMLQAEAESRAQKEAERRSGEVPDGA